MIDWDALLEFILFLGNTCWRCALSKQASPPSSLCLLLKAMLTSLGSDTLCASILWPAQLMVDRTHCWLVERIPWPSWRACVVARCPIVVLVWYSICHAYHVHQDRSAFAYDHNIVFLKDKVYPSHVKIPQQGEIDLPIRTHKLEDAVEMIGFYHSLDASKSNHVKKD